VRAADILAQRLPSFRQACDSRLESANDGAKAARPRPPKSPDRMLCPALRSRMLLRRRMARTPVSSRGPLRPQAGRLRHGAPKSEPRAHRARRPEACHGTKAGPPR